MSRPIKQGLEYYAQDVNSDEKIELIEAKYGIVGFGILIKLYQKIYKEGYYIKWTEESVLLFSKRIDVNIDKVKEVIEDFFNYNLFNKDLYSKYKILTSSGIQKRYLSAIIRRSEVSLCKDFIIVDINGIKVNINWVSADNKYTKYSKVKDSILKQIRGKERFKENPNPISEYKNKQPKKEEIQIQEENPEEDPEAEEEEIQEPRKNRMSTLEGEVTFHGWEDDEDQVLEPELDRMVLFISPEPKESQVVKIQDMDLEPDLALKGSTLKNDEF
jgi:hypothetical protein